MKNKLVLQINIFAVILIVLFSLFILFITQNQGKEIYADDTYIIMDEGWTASSDNLEPRVVTLPEKINDEGSSYYEIKNTLPSEVSERDSMFIRSSQQEVYVYIEDELIYEYNTELTRPFGKTSARSWLKVPMKASYAGKEITIRYTSYFSYYRGTMNQVYIGNESAIIRCVFYSECRNLFIGTILLVAGILCVGVFVIFRHVFEDSRTLLYIGLFAVSISFWMINENKAVQFIYDNPFVINMMPFMGLLTVPLPIMAYINEIEKGRYNKLYRLLTILVSLNIFVQLILAWTNIADFLGMVKYTHIEIFVIMVIMSYTLIATSRKEPQNKDIKAFTRALLILLVCGCCEVIYFYVGIKVANLGVFLSGGIVIFIVMLAYNSAQRIFRVEQAKRDAMASNSAKSQFLARISHEIRNPIHIILGMNEMIMDEETSQAVHEYAVNIKTTAHTLLSIVNDILDISRIEAGKMDIIPVQYRPEAMIREMAEMFRIKAVQKGLRLNLRMDNRIPDLLLGDQTKMRQVISNLVGNAVKYTDVGHIDFAVTCKIEGKTAWLEIAVADTGMGIREEDMDSLFKSFERVNNSNSVEGSGLGLSITKQIVELMKGTIEVESHYGEGSCFTVKLPQEIVRIEKSGSSHTEVAAAKNENILAEFAGSRVLIVDDNVMNLQVMKGFFKNTGLIADCVLSGRECLEICEKKKYDLIFMDHMMPEISGVDTLIRLRENENSMNAKVPVIALTANAITGMREKYIEAGFSEYISKPIEKAKFYEITAQCLKNSSLVQ